MRGLGSKTEQARGWVVAGEGVWEMKDRVEYAKRGWVSPRLARNAKNVKNLGTYSYKRNR